MNNNLKIAGLLSLTILPISSSAYAYGYNYGEPKPEPAPVVNNCDEAVIQDNLAKLSALNIVTVNGLAPIACYTYTCLGNSHRPEVIEADRCAKAEALAKAVTVLAPLAVRR